MTASSFINRYLRLRSWGMPVGILAALLCLSSPSWAAPPLAESLVGSAKADYDAGRILYADGDYAGAALKWDLAYKNSGDPRLLWNIAAARKAQRKYAEVERLVHRYLKEGTELSPEDRAEAQQLLSTIAAFVADLTLQINEPGAQVTLDGEAVGTSPLSEPLRVDIGQHTIGVSKAGYEPVQLSQQVTSNTSLTVTLTPSVDEGRLRIISPPDSTVLVDGKRVTSGTWEGTLSSGPHQVRVEAPGKLPFTTETNVGNNQNEVLRVTLQDIDAFAGGGSRPPEVAERSSSSAWVWVTVAVVVLAGAGAGAYVLLNQEDPEPPPAREGTIDTLYLGLSF